LNASLIFKPWQSLPFRFCGGCDTWGNIRSPSLLDHDASATVPIKLDISDEINLHRNDTVPVLRK
jgi:hypothetical protein